MDGRRFSTSSFEWCLIAAGVVALFAVMPHALANDDQIRIADIELLLHHGHLSSSRYSLIMPLVSSPFLLVGEIVKSPAWWAERFNVVVVATGGFFLWRLLRPTVDARLLRSVLLVLIFASFLSNRLRDYNAEVFTATLVTVGIVTLVVGRHRRLGWLALIVGAVNTPATIFGIAAIGVAEAIRTRRLRWLLPIAIAAALIMLEAWIRRGGPFVTGYENDHGYRTVLPYSGKPGFSYPFVFGAASILFSFGRGLVFFMPGLLLWLSRHERRALGDHERTVGLMMAFVAGLVLVYAKWWAWYGGASWGPRFFAFAALPASVLLGVRLRRRVASPAAALVTLALLTLSAWVGVSGAVAPAATLDTCVNNAFALESLCWYTPEFSSLGHPLVDFPSLTWSTAVVVGLFGVAYAYLAVPIATELAEAVARTSSRAVSSLPSWRF